MAFDIRGRDAFFYPDSKSNWRLPFFGGYKFQSQPGVSNLDGAAFYYTYSGSQTSNAAKNYFNTSSTFYQECNSSIGSTPGSGVFTKTRLVKPKKWALHTLQVLAAVK